jgi:hypothetical protein
MPEPYDSHAQTMTALQRANEVRLARAQLKRDVKSGALLAADVISDPPPCALTMPIAELIAAQRQWGATRASKHCASLGTAEMKTVGSFTTRQRAMIVLGLEGDQAVIERLARRDDAEIERRLALCTRLNGHGPCLHLAGHDGECVTAEARNAIVTFRGFDSGDVLATVNCRWSHQHRTPSVLELVAMLGEGAALCLSAQN